MSKALRPRQAGTDDIESILGLLTHYARMGDLLPRTRRDVETNLAHFITLEENSTIVACGSLEHFTPELAEIRSLMVNPTHKKRGLGRTIVNHLVDSARGTDTRRIMALTYAPRFFHSLGFKTVSKEIFPEKIWGICVNCYKFHHCDEIAVLLKLD